MNEVYELLEVSIFVDSKGKLAEWLSLALDPETGRVGETDGGLLSLASVRDVALILKNGTQASIPNLLQLGMHILCLKYQLLITEQQGVMNILLLFSLSNILLS